MTKEVTIKNNYGNTYIGDSPEYNVDSAINELLNQLASKRFVFNGIKRKPTANTIVKIKYNNLTSKSLIIKQYLDHSSKIETALKDVDSLIPFGKQIILQTLNDLYYSALDNFGIDYLFKDVEIDKIRQNSNQIIDYIIVKLKNASFESDNTPNYKEYIELGVNVIVAYAFIECVIMENPNI